MSAGILLYRDAATDPPGREVLLVHPGGPMWARRDAGAWSIPKGAIDPGEEPLQAARREFAEELGSAPPDSEPVSLGEVRLKSGKRVQAWALAGDLDASAIVSATFEMVWPPRSATTQAFPEVDRAQWFGLEAAKEKLNPAQAAFIDRLAQIPSREATR
jgi:predicted NUDIX family NTP pyrophosphohydrolase